MRIMPNRLLMYMIMIFPVTTVIQGIPLLGSINRFLMVGIIVLMLFSFFCGKVLLKEVIVFFTFLVVYIFNLYYTLNSETIFNTNEFFYFPFWIMFMVYIALKKEYIIEMLRNNVSNIRKIVYVWHLIIILSFVFPSSYKTSWGEATYFISFSGGQHRLASACLLALALIGVIIQFSKEKKDYYLLILPTIVTLMTGARTYLGIVGIFLMCLYYKQSKNKRTFWFSIIPIGLFFTLIVMLSPMGDKILAQFTVSNNSFFDAKGTFTNGRTIFWAADLNAFWDLSPLQQLVGNGSSFVYEVNKIAIFDYIWAHNDYINIVMGFGYIGLVLYVYTYVWSTKALLSQVRTNIIMITGYVLIWLVNAMFNMVYTYTCAVLAIPFLLLSLSYVDTSLEESGEIRKVRGDRL